MSGSEEKTSTIEPGPPPLSLAASEAANDRHARFAAGRLITIPRRPLISPDDRIFTMGSCFAEEIRKALVARGQCCLPDYGRIAFDPANTVIDTLPARPHMNFYNSFTVRLQIEQILDLWRQEPDDYWTVARFPPQIVPWSGGPNFQDPYRRLVVARSPELLKAAVNGMVAEMRRSFHEATAFVFTFGMAEVFINRHSGKAVGQKPLYGGGGGLAETVRHDSTFEENLDNLRAIIGMIRREKPTAPIVMSVSPVPLARTFGPLDVITASMEGKSILRAVLGQVSREFENVAYLPSYEYVTTLGPAGFGEDLRHVRPEVVETIVNAFFDAFVTVPPR